MKNTLTLIATAAIGLLFAGCGTTGKFAGTFGKRHYTKGYYWERAGCGATVTARAGKSSVVASKSLEPKVNDEIKPVFDGTGNNVMPQTIVKRKNNVRALIKDRLNKLAGIRKSLVAMDPQLLKQTTIESPTSNTESSPERHDAKLFMFLGAVFLLTGIIVAGAKLVLPGLATVCILLGLIFLIIGIFDYFSQSSKNNNGSNPPPPANTNPSPVNTQAQNQQPQGNSQSAGQNQTNLGGPGFTMAVLAIAVIAIALITIFAGAATLGFGGALAIVIYGWLGAFILSLIALILCEIALHTNTEKNKKLARAGLIISIITLCSMLLLFI